MQFLSTLSLRRATLELFLYYQDNRISIHALLAESDAALSGGTLSDIDFYPRSPCGERLGNVVVALPMWNFYPRSPCGERRGVILSLNTQQRFLSTLSLRRATNSRADNIKRDKISIHALLAESDLGNVVVALPMWNFYPRSPCGERPVMANPLMSSLYFYPRSPCGERPTNHGQATNTHRISIHALLAESDTNTRKHLEVIKIFLSTLSLRRATFCAQCWQNQT